MAISDGVLIPKSKSIVKTMAGFSKNPAILFAMFLQVPPAIHLGLTWRRCLSVFQDCDKNMAFFTRMSTICPMSRIS